MVCYDPAMGVRNYLIEGVSGISKTSVCKELQRRGYHAINGDTELAYQGDPKTGDPVEGRAHEHHMWHVDRVTLRLRPVCAPNESLTHDRSCR
jgi:broad-specificity NMP kinase